MRKVGLISGVVVLSALFASCSSSSPASGGYFGVSSKKLNAERQKEFQKPKHSFIRKNSTKIKH